MNYEEKYKEALEGIQEILSSGEDSIKMSRLQLRLQGIFPELKESEDERIRKALIELVKFSKKSCFELLKDQSFNIVSMDTMLTWLKKQGNSSIKWNKNTKDCKPKVKHSVLMETTHGIAEGEWQGEKWYQYRWACLIKDTEVLSWMELSNLETQVGPPKEFTITYENEVGNGNTKGLVTSKVLLPKFKVGDWICTEIRLLNISSIENGMYYFDEGDEMSIEFVDKYYHMWTIEDAKDGDVLISKGVPFIHKKHDKDYVYFYCGINLAGAFMKEDNIDIWDDNFKVYPATKEQRDLLFKRMKEEGYEWDAEKKELKKIGPKFKEGDWICHMRPQHIASIKYGTYYFDDGSALSTEFVDKYYNLWTIEDAEDGDVLAFKDGTSGMLLYKENTETFGVLSHCRIIRNNFIDKEESGWGSTLLSPATKEQRDTFFARMKEEGYEWDAENKRLSVIF